MKQEFLDLRSPDDRIIRIFVDGMLYHQPDDDQVQSIAEYTQENQNFAFVEGVLQTTFDENKAVKLELIEAGTNTPYFIGSTPIRK